MLEMMRFQTIFLSMAVTTMIVAAYSPTEHALDIHGVKKILQVKNTVGRDIDGRRGVGSLSVLDVIDANRRAGSRAVGTSHGIDSTRLSRGSVGSRASVSEIIRGSSASMSRALSDDDSISNCHYGCGGDKLCRSGHKCIHNGCSSYCVEISSGSIIGASGLSDSIRREIIRSLSSDLTRVSSNDGHLSAGSRIGSSGLARNLGLSSNSHLENIGSSRVMSGHTGSDILDVTNLRRSGLDVLDTVSLRRGGSVRTSGSGVVSQSVLNGKIGCKKDCLADRDCPTNKYCAAVNCHMICRRRPSNGYTR
ncbi:uncharacterized protein LOC127720439 [Mytilus californianus]|uniref:uncharacterized protein LOC127720439 n=1 Tax=Mytilus californianus TaxID=6549 RepID=UPI0022464FEE|nr:uncharacterized protein LOC127720439 [Mytilus californianus]XP_052082998.1 uncharacterized protein LOC127720439 [Mytilus californianus]